jgi:hypothetical protein
MYKAKALIGEKAGEIIYAKDPNLTHDLCKLWKIYCHECKQFLYFSKSKDPDKRRSYFGHHDYEDKRCPERRPATNQNNQSASLKESHEQDLETAELFIEQVFYGIDREFFQRQKSEKVEENSSLVASSMSWLQENLHHKCKSWVNHYCAKTGFLNWNNPQKESSYLMDWLCILARKVDLLERVSCYFISLYLNNQFNADSIWEKFGISQESIEGNDLIWIMALEKIVDELALIVQGEFKKIKIFDLSSQENFEEKIIPAKDKISFKNKLQIAGTINRKFVVLIRKNKVENEYICFDQKFINRFCLIKSHEEGTIGELVGLYSSQDSFLLYIDQDGDLAVKGSIDKVRFKVMMDAISKILFNGTGYSMLFFLKLGFISKIVAEKASQLALQSDYGDMSPSAALKKFRQLSD